MHRDPLASASQSLGLKAFAQASNLTAVHQTTSLPVLVIFVSQGPNTRPNLKIYSDSLFQSDWPIMAARLEHNSSDAGGPGSKEKRIPAIACLSSLRLLVSCSPTWEDDVTLAWAPT